MLTEKVLVWKVSTITGNIALHNVLLNILRSQVYQQLPLHDSRIVDENGGMTKLVKVNFEY